MPLRGLVETWVPPLALMGVIFALSAQSNLDSGLGVIDLIGRKLVHAATYALLCLLWWRALRTVMPEPPALATAVAIAVLYAVSDEYHQSFVPGREADPLDVLVDALGIAFALALVLNRARSRRTARRAPAPPA